ncbi:MAG: response regulator [Coxiellaceae bacterium]|nr:response regulator [Coxiellaceae bacterium]
MLVVIRNLLQAINRRVEESGAQYKAYGIFGLFTFPVYYFIWLYFDVQSYENLWLRITCTALCLFLVLHDYWPKKLKPYLPVYWYFTLFFTLPFFFTYMLLLNHGSLMWITNTIVIVFFTMLLVDWVSTVILLSSGSLLAIAIAAQQDNLLWASSFDIIGFMLTYVVSILIGLIFSHNKAVIEKIKRRAIEVEANSRARSELIANMNHDIRTPITGILGLAQSFRDTANSNKQASDADLLIRTTEELLTLLNEVIEIVDLENGPLEHRQEAFSIRQVVEHNIALIDSAVNHKLLDLKIDVDHEVPEYVWGNRIYMDRILLNLLGNAIKFTDKGIISLVVRVLRFEKNSVWLEFVLSDTGIGISESQFEKIFERFSRISPSYKGIYKGNGLGLFMVKRYLETMKGSIDVASQEGKGSSFTVRVPFLVAEQTAASLQLPADMTDATASKLVANEDHLATVLVVEDNMLAGRMVKELLTKRGCQVELARTGASALSMSKHKRYDLVLMDIGLPDIDGIEVVRRIRYQQPCANVPIVALTGHMTAELKQNCLNAGMQDTLSKPVSLQTIQQLLHDYLVEKATVDGKIMEQAVIDIEDGAQLAGGNRQHAKEMIMILVDKLPSELEQLQSLAAENKLDMMYELVHKLYGGLCYCGVPQLRAVTKHLKDALHTKDLQQIQIGLQDFAWAVNQVCAASSSLEDA